MCPTESRALPGFGAGVFGGLLGFEAATGAFFAAESALADLALSACAVTDVSGMTTGIESACFVRAAESTLAAGVGGADCSAAVVPLLLDAIA